jgi:hypothetical protein
MTGGASFTIRSAVTSVPAHEFPLMTATSYVPATNVLAGTTAVMLVLETKATCWIWVSVPSAARR